MIGSIEGGLVGQNIMVMAESIGLGGVIIGGIRNNPNKVIELLGLPKCTFPLFGICLGYPDSKQMPWLKPRLPKEIAIFDECYNKESIDEGLRYYEKITSNYYSRRTKGESMDGWSKRISEYITKERRPFLKEKLIKQGFYVNRKA